MKIFTTDTTIFQVSNKQLEKGEVSFEELKAVFQELKIDSRQKLIDANKENKLKVPSYLAMNDICIRKTNKRLDHFCGFINPATKPRKDNLATDADLLNEFKIWCQENNIKSQADYASFKNKPENYPSMVLLNLNYTEDFITEVLGLSKYKKPSKKQIFLTLEEAKAICQKNGILKINHYIYFQREYNCQNETKLPASIPTYYKIKWKDFIKPI